MNSYIAFCPVSEHRLRLWLVRLLGVTVFSFVISTAVLAQAPSDHGRPLRVMTRNLYQGSDFQEAMAMSDLTQLPVAATAIYSNVLATKPESRIAEVAQEIADNTPDLVALQEATVWEVYTPSGKSTIDPVALLLADLNKLGEQYVQVIVQPQFEFGSISGFGFVHTITQIAVLARAETLATQMRVTATQGGVFDNAIALPQFGELKIGRGWAYVDLLYQGKELRFVTAHPEAFSDGMENLQVGELLASGGAADPLRGRSIVMAGDFNTNAVADASPSFRAGYEMIRAAGYNDVWAATETKPGFTCCQSNSLTNPKSLLDERIDFVFTIGAIVPMNAKLTGDKLDSRVDGLWPSDHAGLVARVRVGE